MAEKAKKSPTTTDSNGGRRGHMEKDIELPEKTSYCLSWIEQDSKVIIGSLSRELDRIYRIWNIFLIGYMDWHFKRIWRYDLLLLLRIVLAPFL
jgi:hypothetical protein